MKARLSRLILSVALLLATVPGGAVPTTVQALPVAPAGQALPPGVSAARRATVEENIRQEEYHVTWQDRTYLPDLPASEQALEQRARDTYLKLPLSFISNQGQVDERVDYYAQSGGQSLWFAADRVTIALPETTLRLEFLDASPSARLEGGNKLPGTVNYFTGNDPAKWRTAIPTYDQITYRSLWPGVDLTYQGRPGALKSTFTVAPGADPNSSDLPRCRRANCR